MRALPWIAACAALGLAAPAGAQSAAPDEECRRPPALSDGVTPGLGRLVAPGRTHLLEDGLARAGCPGAGRACARPAYLVAGDRVILTQRVAGHVCALYLPERRDASGTTGWLPEAAVAAEPDAPVTRDDWLGTWTRTEAEIGIEAGASPGTLTVRGEATWGMGDPERLKRGGIHTGEMEGTAAPAGPALSFAMGETGTLPVAQGGADACKVWLRRLGPWLVVDDNLACGGVNVSFRGVYRRKAP